MSDIVERLKEPVSMSMFASKDDMLRHLVKERGEAADEIARLQAENEERRKAQPYVYIGKDGKSVLARDLEDRLIKAEAELSAARDNAAESITWRTDDLNAQLAYARAEALEAGAKEAEAQNCHAVAAAIRRLKEGA